MKTLQVGIIGMGVGEKHLRAFASHESCRIAKLCDFDPEKRECIAAAYPQYQVCADADEILDDRTIDIVAIASYDDAHYDQTVRALKSGKHVYVEKPICQYREQAAEIAALLQERPGLKLSSNLVLRTVPRFKALRDRIRGGELGRLFHLEGDYNYGRIEKLTEGWRGRIDFYSVFYGGGVHIVDLLHWLSGERIVEVQANANRISTEGSAFRYADTVTALLKFEGGSTGKICANFACVYPHFHRLGLYGTAGTFEQSATGAAYCFSRDKDAVLIPDEAEYPGHAARGELIRGFVDAVLHDAEPPVTAQEAFDSMAVCFAVEEAARTGEKQNIHYLEVSR